MAIVYILKVIIVSWMIGHASSLLLNRVTSINKRLHLKFVGNERLNKLIGVGICKWVLVNSCIKYFNPRLQISINKPNLNELIQLRVAMTYAEIVHIVGFAYAITRAIMDIINNEHQSMIASLIVINIFVNLYPVLVQQMNKRRIDRVIKMLMKRTGAIAVSSRP
jgi:hypothetical protein